MKKRTTIFLTVFISIIAMNAMLQANDMKTINRNYEYVQLKGENFPQYTAEQVPIDQLYLYAYRAATGQWEPIPFQVDEMDFREIGVDSTLSYFPIGIEQNQLFDNRDELVFMVRDLGDQADTKKWIDDISASENPRYQIIVTDPYNGANKRGWAYLFRSSNNLPKSTKVYVDYDANLDRASSSNYEIGHDAQGNLDLVKIKTSAPGYYLDILDRNKFRYSGKILFAPYDWSDTSLYKDVNPANAYPPIEIKKGPIRVIRLLHTTLNLEGLNTFKVPFTSRFYSHIFRVSKKIDLIDYDALAKTEHVRFSYDYSDNARGMKFFSGDSGRVNVNQNIVMDGQGKTDGVVDSLSRKKSFWTMVSGAPGSVLSLNDIRYFGGENYSWRLYYWDSSDNDAKDQAHTGLSTGDDVSIGDNGVMFTGDKLTSKIEAVSDIFLLKANFPADSAWTLFDNFNTPVALSINYQIRTDVADGSDGPSVKQFRLLPAYPNPFNALTTISFDLPVRERVVVDIFNINGNYVTTLVDRHFDAGSHQIQWDGRNASGVSAGSGVYFIKLQTETHFATVKTILLK
ncbi:MAG: FlgD immunoglobulin-like domain containing protein [Candidatus Zhuqueibacterota bacterium]